MIVFQHESIATAASQCHDQQELLWWICLMYSYFHSQQICISSGIGHFDVRFLHFCWHSLNEFVFISSIIKKGCILHMKPASHCEINSWAKNSLCTSGVSVICCAETSFIPNKHIVAVLNLVCTKLMYWFINRHMCCFLFMVTSKATPSIYDIVFLAANLLNSRISGGLHFIC